MIDSSVERGAVQRRLCHARPLPTHSSCMLPIGIKGIKKGRERRVCFLFCIRGLRAKRIARNSRLTTRHRSFLTRGCETPLRSFHQVSLNFSIRSQERVSLVYFSLRTKKSMKKDLLKKRMSKYKKTADAPPTGGTTAIFLILYRLKLVN